MEKVIILDYFESIPTYSVAAYLLFKNYSEEDFKDKHSEAFKTTVSLIDRFLNKWIADGFVKNKDDPIAIKWLNDYPELASSFDTIDEYLANFDFTK